MCVCVGWGATAVHIVHSQRVLMESYGTSILRQGVMHRGESGRGGVGGDRSLSLTGLTYISPLLNRERERVIGRYTFAVQSALFLDSVFRGGHRGGNEGAEFPSSLLSL